MIKNQQFAERQKSGANECSPRSDQAKASQFHLIEKALVAEFYMRPSSQTSLRGVSQS